MKTCPTCNRNYENEMKFCLNDGSSLVAETASGMTVPSGADATLHLPGHSTEQPPAVTSPQAPPPAMPTMRVGSPASGPGPAGANRTKSSSTTVLLWVGAAVIIAFAGILVAVALVVMRNREQPLVTETPTPAVSPAETTTATESSATSPVAESQRVEVSETKAPGQLPIKKENVPVVKGLPGAAPAGISESAPASAPPPPPPVPAPRAPISGGVLNGKAIRLVTPTYPAIAKQVHASGPVRVSVLIDENGNVVSASAISGHPLLQASAVSAARASKFTPTKLSGQPVKVSGVIIYNFVAQ